MGLSRSHVDIWEQVIWVVKIVRAKALRKDDSVFKK